MREGGRGEGQAKEDPFFIVVPILPSNCDIYASEDPFYANFII